MGFAKPYMIYSSFLSWRKHSRFAWILIFLEKAIKERLKASMQVK